MAGRLRGSGLIAWTAARAFVGRMPIWIWVVVVALAWGAFQHHRASAAGRRALQAQKDLADLRADAAATTIKTLTHAIAGQQEAIHAAEEQTASADIARAAVAGSLAGLLDRYRAAQRGRAAAPASGASAPAAAGSDLCPQLLGRMGEAAGRYADAADRARIAGEACARSYEALTLKP